MAEDVIARCEEAGLLNPRETSRTVDLQLIGAPGAATHKISDLPGAHLYGTEAAVLDELPGDRHELGMGLTEAMVRFAVRYEAARTVEDVLARRSRILFLDAEMAAELAEEVATIIAEETGRGRERVARFKALAQRYRTLPG
jgi:glycerol-3-phosphate dehydrogenase